MRFPAPLKRLSLVARILIMVGMALAVAYPVSIVLFVDSELAFYRAASEKELVAAMETMEKAVGEQVVIGDYALIEQILRARVRASSLLEISFTDIDGNVVTATTPQPAVEYPAWFRSWLDLSDKPASRPIAVGNKPYGQLTVWPSHVAFRNQLWHMILQQVALVLGVGLTLFAAVGWVLRRGLMPLRTATELALSLRRGEYQCLAYSPAHAAPEIRDTLATFNDAATREAWLAHFAEIISGVDAPARKVRSVMALLCARLDMQGAVLAHQAARGGFAVKAAYLASEEAEGAEWQGLAAQVAALGTPVVVDGQASAAVASTGARPQAYIGVPVHMVGYECVVFSLFGEPSGSLERRNGEVELVELCADWIGTTLTQAEYDQRMREQKEHAESVLNGVMEGIVTLDHHGIIISANPAMEQIFRSPVDWIIGQPLVTFLPRLDWNFIETRLALQAVRTGLPDAIWQEEGKRSDGEAILMEMSAKSVRRGDAALTVVVLRDVTERIRAEEALRRSEARRRRAQEIAQLGSLEYFPATGKTHWSGELRQILGVPTGPEFSYEEFLLRVELEDRLRVASAFETGVAQGRAFSLEFRVVRPGGEVRDVVLSAEAPERDEYSTKLFAVVQDVTERKQADAKVQAALVEKLQAEAHNRAKTLFLANMSHELRTPLNAILGYSDMLEEEARAEGRKTAVSDLHKIQAAGKHLLSMINEVLDLSKIEAGRIDLVLEGCAPRALIEDVLATIEPLASKNGNVLRVKCDVGDAAIHTDAMKLKQVLINLLSNACKFTQNGTISFGVRREHEGGREWLRVAVEDSGIGMTTEQLDRVFVPFVQADATTSRKYGGTGLGLAISKRFVEMMGGEIMAASVPNRGSTFSLRIPVDQVAEAATAEARDTPAARIIEAAGRALDSRRGERRSQVASVLIVEPDPSLRELMERYLSGEGFRVVSSGSGDDIEVLAERHAPVLIVLDLELPAMVPAQLAARLKASRASDIPLIVLGPAGHTPETRTLGAADCLGKPLNWAMLGALSKKWARAGGARVDVSPSLASRAAAGGKSGA